MEVSMDSLTTGPPTLLIATPAFTESYLAGAGAAKYVKGLLKKDGKDIKFNAKNGVRYTVPQHIRVDNVENEVNLFMRVGDVYKDVYLVAKDGDKVIYKAKKRIVAPGEMERVKLKKEVLSALSNNEVTVELTKEV
jgi:hypothetical protein